MNAAFINAQNSMAFIYCGDERCTFAEALADFGAVHVGRDGDFQIVEKGGQRYGMWTDGWGWVAFAV